MLVPFRGAPTWRPEGAEFPCEIVAIKTQTKRIAAKQINKRVRLMCTSIARFQFKSIQNRLNPESGKRNKVNVQSRSSRFR